jgi:quercetin dioxygenase-like cupin family protein
MNAQAFEDFLKAEKYGEIANVSKDVGYKMDEHQHAFDACALITAGQIDITVDGVTTEYKVGDIFRLSAGTVHLEDASRHGVIYLVGRRHSGNNA